VWKNGKELSLVACDSMPYDRNLPEFRRIMLPPCSRYDKKEAAVSSETSINSYQSTWSHMQENGILF